MYAVGRGAARLLLVAAFVVAVVVVERPPRQPGLPRSKPSRVYRPNKDAMKLLDHVMMREEQWTYVLQEPIKLLGEPPHKERKFHAPKVGRRSDLDGIDDPEVSLYDVRDIVDTVTRHYSGIRSFVEYGAKAVRRALACFTFKQVVYQSSNISMLMFKGAEENSVMETAYSFKKNMTSYIDVLSAVPDNDLTFLLEAYWHAIKVLQYKGIQLLEKVPYPKDLIKSMDNLTSKINRFLDSHCMMYTTDEDFFQRTGISKESALMRDPSIELMLPMKTIVSLTREQSQHMARTAHALGIVTLSDQLWSSLFFYRGRPRMDDTYRDPSKSKEDPSEADPSTSEAEDPSEADPLTSDAGPSGIGPST